MNSQFPSLWTHPCGLLPSRGTGKVERVEGREREGGRRALFRKLCGPVGLDSDRKLLRNYDCRMTRRIAVVVWDLFL